MNFLKLTEEKLDIGVISELVGDETCGAISVFAGTTRNNFEDKTVISLEYEAYQPMAIKIMTNICDEIRSKWPDIMKIAIFHRLNVVPVKEASVVIAISSPHRQSSLESVQFAIDELKRTVPIWKKELYDNNAESWKANKECSDGIKKRSKLDFDKCMIDMDPIPKNLIQITANDSEIKRRINYFIDKKREEIDINNILDFTSTNRIPLNPENDDNETYSCARLDSVLLKRNDSEGHLRVHRVKNVIGPLDHDNYKRTLDKLRDNLYHKKQTAPTNQLNNGTERLPLPIGVCERIENIEEYLNINNPIPKNVYERLKIMENKILHLESISPEYKHFLGMQIDDSPEIKFTETNEKKIFTVDEVEFYINNLKDKISEEIKTEK